MSDPERVSAGLIRAGLTSRHLQQELDQANAFAALPAAVLAWQRAVFSGDPGQTERRRVLRKVMMMIHPEDQFGLPDWVQTACREEAKVMRQEKETSRPSRGPQMG